MRSWVILTAFLFLGATQLQAAPPNVLLIVVDDLGYGDLGCYGSKEIKTPHLDQLAKQGVRLTDAYAAAPVCSPTRAALLTGRYPQKTGFEWVINYTEKDRGLLVADSVLAKNMKAAGYSTALYGKWHLGYKPQFGPNAHGFDDFFGFPGADLDYFSHKDALGDPGLYHNTELINEEGYLTDLLTKRAEQFLDKNAGKPFFMEVAYNAPHWPFQRPDKPDLNGKATYGPAHGTRADYVKIVERLDEGIGRVLKKLEDLKLADNTLVLFLNDNGGERLSDNTPLFHGKYSLWEGGIRVPCMVRWPGVVPSGKDSSLPVIAMDLTATILKNATGKIPENLDGEDIIPWISGKQEAKPRTLFWRLPRPNSRFGQRAVRYGNWKYIFDRESELLFDLANDIGERKNLAYQHPEILKEIREKLIKWETSLPALPSSK
ncbi:sulfatase [Telmatocola sphagniphila]|uniref:Sulfatase n=1 Tax=Telmatocola sphagniphila TaxID=1123043 RepID=A0A8E6B1B6_9BACT|nr:sulfatase [Telmatocola sphagniphila]QVL29922.1 sulfatase [Telmatocola sphagniphila]